MSTGMQKAGIHVQLRILSRFVSVNVELQRFLAGTVLDLNTLNFQNCLCKMIKQETLKADAGITLRYFS